MRQSAEVMGMAKYQIPSTKSQGVREEKQEDLNLNAETRTLKPYSLLFVIWNF
jgi:hypothetical protein